MIESIAQIARKNAPFWVDLLFDTFDWWKMSAGERNSFFVKNKLEIMYLEID